MNATLQLNDDTHIIVDSGCVETGTLTIGEYGHILSPSNETELKIYGGSIIIDDHGSISSANSTLIFSERCNADESIGLGAPSEGFERMTLSQSELNRLTAGKF